MVKELRLEEVSNRKAADEKDTPQPGVVGGNRELHRTTYEKGMLDLRLQLTKMRIDYLTQINTQTTFIAGCAVGMLSSQELMALDDVDGTPISAFRWWWLKIFDYTYTCSALMCFASSVWVIYTAMNLITMSIHSSLYGQTMQSITESDFIIEARMKEVRLVFVATLAELGVATLSMLSAHTDTMLMVFGIILFAVVGWHASASDQGTVRVYEQYTELQLHDRWDSKSQNWKTVLTDLVTPYGYQTSTNREKLHDRADPIISAFVAEVSKAAVGRGAHVLTYF